MFSPAYLWLGSRYPEGSKRDKKKGVESRILFSQLFVVALALAIPKDLFLLLEERSQLEKILLTISAI